MLTNRGKSAGVASAGLQQTERDSDPLATTDAARIRRALSPALALIGDSFTSNTFITSVPRAKRELSRRWVVGEASFAAPKDDQNAHRRLRSGPHKLAQGIRRRLSPEKDTLELTRDFPRPHLVVATTRLLLHAEYALRCGDKRPLSLPAPPQPRRPAARTVGHLPGTDKLRFHKPPEGVAHQRPSGDRLV